MTREEAFNLLNTLIKNPNLVKHHLACEAVMRTLAIYFKTDKNMQDIDEDKWAITGLLHDADYDITRYEPEKHTKVFEEKYGNQVDPDVLYAIKAHNYKNNKVEPKSIMDWTLYCCDELTGLIIASVLVSPDRKLSLLTSDFILRKFNEGSFAKGCDRQQIKLCEEKLGIPLLDFIGISLRGMQIISEELGF
jgi:uncharacterized protein